VRLERAVREDVRHLGPRRDQLASDQDRPVAIERLALGAHHGDMLRLAAVEQALDTRAEERGLREATVLDFAVHVARRVLAPRAKLLPKEDVRDPSLP